jgi:hypothetical protein
MIQKKLRVIVRSFTGGQVGPPVKTKTLHDQSSFQGIPLPV